MLKIACQGPKVTAKVTYGIGPRGEGGCYIHVFYDPDDVLEQQKNLENARAPDEAR
jgi:hypothetical protein